MGVITINGHERTGEKWERMESGISASPARVELDGREKPLYREGLGAAFIKCLGRLMENPVYKNAMDNYVAAMGPCESCPVNCPIKDAADGHGGRPCDRASALVRTYRRYFGEDRDLSGGELEDLDVLDMEKNFWECLNCGACLEGCSRGADSGMIIRLGRMALMDIGLGPREILEMAGEQLEGERGNTAAVPAEAVKRTLDLLEEEMADELGLEVEAPMDKKNSRFLFVPSIGEIMAETDALMGFAAVMRAAGLGGDWTMGSGHMDASNPGLYYSDEAWEKTVARLLLEVNLLGAKAVVIGESGHGARAAKVGVPLYGRGVGVPVLSAVELTYKLLEAGRLHLKPGAIEGKVTYHDPCNVARSGWITEQPRRVLAGICDNLVEMTPHSEKNYCCGGGGGPANESNYKFRMEVAGLKKAEQLAGTRADYVVTICDDCKRQLRDLIHYHGLNMEVVGLHDLVLRSIDWKTVSS